MAEGRAVDRKELYRMICALSDADIQKAVSYVSFLRFVDVSQEKDIAELLKAAPFVKPDEEIVPAPPSSIVEIRPDETAVTFSEEHVWAEEPSVELPKPKIEFLKPETEFSRLEIPESFPETEPETKPETQPETKAKPEVSTEPEPAGLHDVGDFYTPVRSSRLDQPEEPKPAKPRKKAEPSKLESLIPRLKRELEESVHSLFDTDKESGPSSKRERRETPPPLFEPGDDDGERKSVSNAADDDSEENAASGPRHSADDFFMPVRSERFDQLRRPPEPESRPEPEIEPEPEIRFAPAEPRGSSRHEEPEELSMFQAEPIPVPVYPVTEKEKPKEAIPLPTPGAKDEPEEEPVFELAPEPEAPSEEEPPSEEEQRAELMRTKLRRLLMAFRLTYDEVAKLFDAPTSVVYSWFEGVPSDSGQEARLEYFLDVADRVEKEDIPRPELAFQRCFASGETFLEKLKRQKITGQDIKILKEIADRSEELRHKPKGATKPFYTFEEAIELYSTPLYGEAE